MGMEGSTIHDNDSGNSASTSLSPTKVQKPKGVEAVNLDSNDPTGDLTDVWARGVGSEEEGAVKVSHSKKVIKHALKQQAKRRRKNTNIAAGCNSAPRLQSHGSPSELDEVNVNIGVCYRQPTMAEVLSSIPGFNLKPRKRSNKKLSAAAQLEQTKEGCVDLETPDSILVNSNVRQLLNKHTFSSLPPLYQYKLLQLLPHVDRILGHSDYVYRLSPTGLNNEFFTRACMDWRERLTEGEFTPENQAKLKADQDKEKTKLDPWKLKHFEPMWGESLEEWPSVPPGVLERCGSSVTPGINAPVGSTGHEQTAPPPVKKKRGSGGNIKPPAPPPPPRPVRTVGAVTRAQSSYREKRQAELTSQQNNKKPKSALDEVVVETIITVEDVTTIEDKVMEPCPENDNLNSEVFVSSDRMARALPKSPVQSVKSPLRVSSPSPVKSSLPKSPRSPVTICKSPSPSIKSPAPKSPISGVASPIPVSKSPIPSGRSPTPTSKSPIRVRSPISSCRSPRRVRSPLTGAKSPLISPKSPEISTEGSPVRTESPLPNEEISGSEVVSELTLIKTEPPCVSHLIYQVDDNEDTQPDKLEGATEVGTSSMNPMDKAHHAIVDTVTNETSVSVSSIETTIVYSVSNCSSDISFNDKRDCEVSEVSCSTENIERTFESLGQLGNTVLGGEALSNPESDTRQPDESPKSSKMEETLEKPDEEDWEIIKVDPNSTETLQDDQVSGLCSNEGSNLSCVTTNTEPDKLDEGSKCSSFNTEESYSATDVLLYQDPLKDDEAALLAAAWDAVGSTTTDKILRDIQNQHQQLNIQNQHQQLNRLVSGEVSVIPCQEELEVRLEETSLPAWDVVTSQPQNSQPPQQHSHVKLELEVTLTPEVDSQVSSSTIDGSNGRKEVGCCQPVIPPTTIVCLPPASPSSIVAQTAQAPSSLPPPSLPPLQQPTAPASSSALPYIALTTSTPVRALPTKTLSKTSNVNAGRLGRNVNNKPPPGAVNLERSYQICQAVIQNSPNREQLQGQLRPPPGLRPSVGHRVTVRAAPPAQSVRYPPSGPRPKPQQVLLKQVFTSQHHGIPVNMAVLPNSPHHINNNHQMSEYVIMRSGGLRRSNSAPPGGGGGGRLVGAAPRPASTAAPPQSTADCLCSLKPMQACLKCGAFCHQDCISPSRLCITCFTQ